MKNWHRQIIRECKELLKLPEGWDSYKAKRIEADAVLAAIEVLLEIMSDDAEIPSVVPLNDGGVQLEWHPGGYDLEIVCRPGKEPVFFYEHRGKEMEGLVAGNRVHDALRGIIRDVYRPLIPHAREVSHH